MATCKKCKKQIGAGKTYCQRCLNDPTPLKPIVAKPRSTPPSPKKHRTTSLVVASMAVLLVLVVWIPNAKTGSDSYASEEHISDSGRLQRAKALMRNGDFTAALDDLYAIPQTAPEYRESQTLISVAVQKQKAHDEKFAAEEARRQAEPPKSKSSDRIVELLGYALTEQYDKQTPWSVRVSGNDATKTLYFDCSDDPHPKDVCLLLYKNYPSEKEAQVLRLSGVRRLVFSAGGLSMWEKSL